MDSIYEHKQTVIRQELQTESAILLENEKVKPYLQLIFRKVNSEQQKGIVVKNAGAGPAKVTSFKYFLNEKAYQDGDSLTSWLDKNGFLIFTKDTLVFEELNVLTKGYVISPGSDGEVFLLRDTDSKFYETQARKDMERLIIEIEYKSLSSLDTTNYYLRYCEKFESNNIRDKNTPNTYEK